MILYLCILWNDHSNKSSYIHHHIYIIIFFWRDLLRFLNLATFTYAIHVTGDRSKVQCCKEQYCIGTCNVRSMNQGKLEVVKQEMARVNVDILGISELKWNGMGEFNSGDHYIYYCGQESLRRNGVAIMVNKRTWNAVLGSTLKKWQNDLCSFPRQTIQYHGNPSLWLNQ